MTSDHSDIGPVKYLAYDPKTGSHKANALSGKFIKGPISLEWISRANALPGKTGAVGLALWFLVGVQKSRTIKLTGEVEQIAACHRKTIYQALANLEVAKLVQIEKKSGSRPIVTICDVRGTEPTSMY